jgi:hypothetical protein
VKCLGLGVDHTPASSIEVKERVELYIPILPLWAFMACSGVNVALFYLHLLTEFFELRQLNRYNDSSRNEVQYPTRTSDIFSSR